MATYTHISDETLAIALPLARGCYQRRLLHGYEAWSGGTLRGAAKKYSARYQYSAVSFLRRLMRYGFAVENVTGHHNRNEKRITSRMTNR